MPESQEGPARARLNDVSVRFGSTVAVEALSLDLEPGSFTALLGPSGCGKSTTLGVLAGLQRPTSGDVLLDEASVRDLAPERRPISLVLQKPLLFPHLTVEQNVGFGLRMERRPRAEIAERVARMLARVRLEGLGARRPDELSGGQEQRVALARALVRRPRLLLLDEPFSQLDADLRAQMRELVRELHDELDVTTLFVTHDRDEAVAVADRIALMLEGSLAGTGTPKEIYTRPATRAIAEFFGFTALWPGTVAAGAFRAEDDEVVVAGVAGVNAGPAVLVVRPEAVVVGAGDREATVTGVRFAGTHVVIDLVLDSGHALTAHAPVGTVVTPSARICVGLPAAACTTVPP